jgi:hypothetical protein
MAKSKTRTETEFLRGKVRELESEVKKLRKVASRNYKKAQQLENVVDERKDEEFAEIEAKFEPTMPRCPECLSNKDFEIVPLGAREMHLCNDCGYRKTYARKK